MMDDDMQEIVRGCRLGYVASVCPDGTPNLSPKGTLTVWEDERLVFLDLHSPQTVTNIDAGHGVVEVNVVDPIRRRGYRFKGPAEVLRDGPTFEQVVRFYEEERGTAHGRIKSAVLVTVEHAAALLSPAYDDGTSEDEIAQRSLDMYGLVRTPPRA